MTKFLSVKSHLHGVEVADDSYPPDKEFQSFVGAEKNIFIVQLRRRETNGSS